MNVTAWNIGSHNRNGSGYGFKVKKTDRDAFFQKQWKSILLEIPDEAEPVEINIDGEKFWSENGHELICTPLGKWLRKNGLAPWRHGNPPSFDLEPVEENRFRVEKGQKTRKPF